MKKTIREIDRGWNQLRRELKKIRDGKAYVKIGVFGNDPRSRRPGERVNSVELALIHEFGAPKARIPERSFIRAPFDANRAGYVLALATKLLPRVYENRMSIRQALGIVGLMAERDMQKWVRQGSNLAPLAESTRAAKEAKTRPGSKGVPRPLIDTGRLLGSITHVVVVPGGGRG